LATRSSEGFISTSPIQYVLTGNHRLRFITKDETTKYKNILENGSVALSIVSVDQVVAVNITGRVKVVTNQLDANKTMKQIGLFSLGKDIPPVIKMSRGSYVVIEITPEHIQYTNFSEEADSFSDYIFDL